MLRQMEDDVWLAVIQILIGQFTALQAFLELVRKWEEQDLYAKLSDEIRFFFRRGVYHAHLFTCSYHIISDAYVPYSPQMSVFTSFLSEARPDGWDLPDAATPHIVSPRDDLQATHGYLFPPVVRQISSQAIYI